MNKEQLFDIDKDQLLELESELEKVSGGGIINIDSRTSKIFSGEIQKLTNDGTLVCKSCGSNKHAFYIVQLIQTQLPSGGYTRVFNVTTTCEQCGAESKYQFDDLRNV